VYEYTQIGDAQRNVGMPTVAPWTIAPWTFPEFPEVTETSWPKTAGSEGIVFTARQHSRALY